MSKQEIQIRDISDAVGKIGEMFGTERASGTAGSSFSVRNTTALTGSPANVISLTLNKGTYLISAKINGHHNNGVLRGMYGAVGINGTLVTSNLTIPAPSGSDVTYEINGVPIIIKEDAVTVSIVAYVASLSSAWSVVGNEMWAIRIA